MSGTTFALTLSGTTSTSLNLSGASPVFNLGTGATGGYINMVALSSSTTGAKLYNYGGNLYWGGTNIIGSLMPTGTTGQTLYYNGTNWVATSNLYNNGTNIGIGTTSPSALLEISQSGADALQFDRFSGYYAYIGLSDPVGVDGLRFEVKDNTVGIDWLDGILITPHGGGTADKLAVGIASTSPQALLHVWQDNNAISPLPTNLADNNLLVGPYMIPGAIDGAVVSTDNGSGHAGFYFADQTMSSAGSSAGNYFSLYDYASNASIWTPTTGNIITFASNGNVGIGTTSPANALDVCGTIRAKEVTVQTGWCDYVFNPAYNLPPLDETEKFIKQNNHLPDVPTTEDVEKNGVKVGEMEAVLLKKVEEMTLYIIDLKKQNDKLQVQIDELKAQKADK